jgi:hypothetical protein
MWGRGLVTCLKRAATAGCTETMTMTFDESIVIDAGAAELFRLSQDYG